MGLRKCPRCELNYIRDDQQYCDVCKRAMSKAEPAAEEETVMCSECGENPAVKGSDLCAVCMRERRLQAKFTAAKEELDTSELGIDELDEIDVAMDDSIPQSELEEIDKELSNGTDDEFEDDEEEEEFKDEDDTNEDEKK